MERRMVSYLQAIRSENSPYTVLLTVLSVLCLFYEFWYEVWFCMQDDSLEVPDFFQVKDNLKPSKLTFSVWPHFLCYLKGRWVSRALMMVRSCAFSWCVYYMLLKPKVRAGKLMVRELPCFYCLHHQKNALSRAEMMVLLHDCVFETLLGVRKSARAFRHLCKVQVSEQALWHSLQFRSIRLPRHSQEARSWIP